MPRIRKKTSNRQTIKDRRKIQHKVKEGRKKKVKLAKKNPQWKSKQKKDPGIPNDFPYKDQILAEVAEQRRLANEEKEKRKEEKRLLKKQKRGDGEDQASEEEQQKQQAPSASASSRSLDVGSEAIASLSAKLINPKLRTSEEERVEAEVDEESDGDETPILLNRDLPTLKAVLNSADVLLEILDARDPLAFRSSYLEKLVEGKKVLLVLNKIDTCPREALAAWLTYLRREHPTHAFRSATAFLPAVLESIASAKGTAKRKTQFSNNDAVGGEAILNQLSEWARGKGETPLNVAVVGLTNVGKSCFLNSLLHKATLPMYTLPSSSRGPTTTILPQEVAIESNGRAIRFIDTPGLTWTPEEDPASSEGAQARDILLRSKGRIDRLKDPSPAISHIISCANTEDLMLMYSLPAFAKGDPTAFLSGIARSNQLVKKRGELDLVGASRIVLKDWNTGRFARYTLPPASVDNKAPAVVMKLDDADEKILGRLRTRKEMRKGGGLVKMTPSVIDTREIPVERPWEEEESGDEDDEEDSVDTGTEIDEEGEEDEVEEEEEVQDDSQEEDDITPSQPPQKRRREPSFSVARPSKKVTFASGNSVRENKGSQEQATPRSILKKTDATPSRKPLIAHSEKVQSKVIKRSSAMDSKKVKAVNTVSSRKSKAETPDPHAYDFSKFF